MMDRAKRFPLLVVLGAMLALWLGGEHEIRKPPLAWGSWVLLSGLCLPLGFAILLDLGKKGLPWLLALLGFAVALVGLSVGSWVDPVRDQLKQDPLPLLVLAGVSLGLLGISAWKGAVPLGDWGALAGDWRWWLPKTALLLLGTLLLVLGWVWLDPAMREFYPYYKPARTDFGALLGWCGAMALYLVGWEFFWRGYLLFGVARTAGPLHSILFQSLPFFLVHSGKPETEMLGSFFIGALLAAFCWRARSFWPAALLHTMLNTSIQVVCFFW